MYEEEIHFWNCYLNGFGRIDTGDLDLWPSDPTLIWFLCYTGQMCGPSLRKVGQSILELLIGNEKVTDGQTDMCKAICPLFFEGGHKKYP